MIHMSQVGVAPGTTTVRMPYASGSEMKGRGLGIIDTSKWWVSEWRTGRDYYPVQPMFDASKLKPMGLQGAGLGIVMPEPVRALSGAQLGLIPRVSTDAQLVPLYNYLPVRQGIAPPLAGVGDAVDGGGGSGATALAVMTTLGVVTLAVVSVVKLVREW